MSVAVSLPDEALAADGAFVHFDGQMGTDMVLHVTELAVLDVAVETGELLEAEARLLVQIVSLGEARVDLLLELQLPCHHPVFLLQRLTTQVTDHLFFFCFNSAQFEIYIEGLLDLVSLWSLDALYTDEDV